MNKSLILLLSLVAVMLLMAGCTTTPSTPTTVPTTVATTPPVVVTTQASALANPAATYCAQQPNTRYEIRKNPDGSEYGVCILPGGVECEEWAYFRGTCPPASGTPPVQTTSTGIANPSATYCVLQNNTYQIVTNPDGSQAGNCVFPNGKACDGWAYYRGECNETTAK